MPIDSQIVDLTHFAQGFNELKNLRAGDANGQIPSESRRAAESKIQELKTLRKQIRERNPNIRLDKAGERAVQERGIFLQIELEGVLKADPQIFLENIDEYREKYQLSSEELSIFTSIAKEALKKQNTVKGVLDQFCRSARKNLRRSEDQDYIDISLRFEVGRLIFKALTSKKPDGRVRWIESSLAVCIEVEYASDRKTLFPALVDSGKIASIPGIYQDDTEIKTGFFSSLRIPLILLGNERQERVQSHEEKHHINNIIRQALKPFHAEISSRFFGPYSSNEQYNTIGIKARKDIQTIANGNFTDDDATQKLLDVLEPVIWKEILVRAKDEIIADFSAASNFSYLRMLRIQEIDDDDTDDSEDDSEIDYNVYDYLAEVGLEKNVFKTRPEIYNRIVRKYNTDLSVNVDYLNQVWSTYKNTSDADACATKIIDFMHQNPLTEWKNNGSVYFDADRLTYTSAKIRNLISYLETPTLENGAPLLEKLPHYQTSLSEEDKLASQLNDLIELKWRATQIPPEKQAQSSFIQFLNDLSTLISALERYISPERQTPDCPRIMDLLTQMDGMLYGQLEKSP